MKVFVLILAVFLSGCDSSEKGCVEHCVGNVSNYCGPFEGPSGRFYEHRTLDCAEKGFECLEFSFTDLNGSTSESAACILRTDRCSDASKICVDGKESYCVRNNDGIFALIPYFFTCSDNEECVELNGSTRCFIPVDECNPEANSICIDKSVAVCYKINDKYYILFLDNCENTDCIYDPETKSAYCPSDEE